MNSSTVTCPEHARPRPLRVDSKHAEGPRRSTSRPRPAPRGALPETRAEPRQDQPARDRPGAAMTPRRTRRPRQSERREIFACACHFSDRRLCRLVASLPPPRASGHVPTLRFACLRNACHAHFENDGGRANRTLRVPSPHSNIPSSHRLFSTHLWSSIVRAVDASHLVPAQLKTMTLRWGAGGGP